MCKIKKYKLKKDEKLTKEGDLLKKCKSCKNHILADDYYNFGCPICFEIPQEL